MKSIKLYLTFQKENHVKYGFRSILDDLTTDCIDVVVDERKKTMDYIIKNTKVWATFMRSSDLSDFDHAKYIRCDMAELYSMVKKVIETEHNNTTIWIDIKETNYL